jgi:hypothetical protein
LAQFPTPTMATRMSPFPVVIFTLFPLGFDHVF